MEKVTLKVPGMSCGHCVKAIEDAMEELVGVEECTVNLETKLVDLSYDSSKVELGVIKETIEDEGYDIEE